MSRTKPKIRRREIVGEIEQALRRQSGLTVLFHQAVAERLGLHASDHKCLDLLLHRGAATAGELAVQSGLTTGAITGVIDRLERVGYARRTTDPRDRRRVVVEPVVDRAMAEVGPLFRDLATATAELCAQFTDGQLRDILTFIAGCETLLEEQTRRLQAVAPMNRPARGAGRGRRASEDHR